MIQLHPHHHIWAHVIIIYIYIWCHCHIYGTRENKLIFAAPVTRSIWHGRVFIAPQGTTYPRKNHCNSEWKGRVFNPHHCKVWERWNGLSSQTKVIMKNCESQGLFDSHGWMWQPRLCIRVTIISANANVSWIILRHLKIMRQSFIHNKTTCKGVSKWHSYHVLVSRSLVKKKTTSWELIHFNESYWILDLFKLIENPESMALVSVSSICYSLCKTTEVRKKCCIGNRGDENTALCHNKYTKIVARPLTANDVSFYWQSNRKLVPCGWSSISRWWVSLDDCNILRVNMRVYIYIYSNSHSLFMKKTKEIINTTA